MKYFSVGQQWVLFVIALLLLGSLTFRFYYQPHPTPSEEAVKEIVLEVLGEVRQPGIYLFQNPPNLREAIGRAGGLKETAQYDTTLSSTILETGTLLTVVKESSQIYLSPPHTFPLPPGEREKRNGPLLKEQHKTIQQDEIKIRIGMKQRKYLIYKNILFIQEQKLLYLILTPQSNNARFPRNCR